MSRRMADSEFRNEQWQHRYDEHIAQINGFVDELCRNSWVPYVAPMYGGVNAILLSVLSDPGPKTKKDGGSGFLCMENDDPTAERISKLFGNAGIDACDVLPWNVYPWYINRKPKPIEIKDGIEHLKHIIDLLPALRVVMLHGRDAQNGWKKLTRYYPNLDNVRGLYVIETYHPSPQAFRHPDQGERERRHEHLCKAFHEASRYLRL